MASTRCAGEADPIVRPQGRKSQVRFGLLLPPLHLLALLARTFSANRERLKVLMSRPRLARGFRAMVMITALLWLLIHLFADDEHGERLNRAFSEMRQAPTPEASERAEQ